MAEDSKGDEKDFSEGFWKAHGLPSEKERKTMNVVQIAELLSKENNEKSVQHIVLSHELQMKIAQEQINATMAATWMRIKANFIYGIIFIFGGGVIGFLAGRFL